MNFQIKIKTLKGNLKGRNGPRLELEHRPSDNEVQKAILNHARYSSGQKCSAVLEKSSNYHFFFASTIYFE